ncbi:hypothetical protein BDY19DRAFT_905524 [Irpex rosettiformis]|uniref:Uncharacterized protein n=1 Tax=Irpex rosettiformis TaxID=378272 RepID=A0ACB8U633_9APHY|nr:hypothetical protein BDY19DRAFT_905524 [Irpex rosettiformis]
MERADSIVPSLSGPQPSAPNTRDDDEHSAHNALQPILKLPDEVLLLILSFLRRKNPLCLTHATGGYTPGPGIRRLASSPYPCPCVRFGMGWAKTTHVCRRLRHVALNDPALWTTLYIGESAKSQSCKDWLPELLQRSRNLPIELELYPIRTDIDQVNAVLAQSTAVKTLFVRDAADWLSFLRVLINTPARYLERLEMSLDKSHRDAAMIPGDLFMSSAPRLCFLSLTGFDLAWSSFAFPTLTHLTIVRPADKSSQETFRTRCIWELDESSPKLEGLDSSMNSVASTLRSLPLLQSLVLEHALPTQEEDVTGLSRISLLHLHKLKIIQRPTASWSSLLALLDAPNLQHFRLSSPVSTRPRGNASQEYYRSLTLFLSDFTYRLPSPITGLHIMIEEDKIMLRASVGEPESWLFCPWSARTYGFLDISLYYAENSRTLENGRHRHVPLETIITSLPLDNLYSLSFWDTVVPDYTEHVFDFSLWRSIFDKCANAQSLSVTSLTIIPLLPLLATRNLPTWTIPPLASPRTPVFPSLQHLQIGTDFRRSMQDYVVCYFFCQGLEKPEDVVEESGHEVLLDAIRQCLLSREGYAPVLKRLRGFCRHCGVFEVVSPKKRLVSQKLTILMTNINLTTSSCHTGRDLKTLSNWTVLAEVISPSEDQEIRLEALIRYTCSGGALTNLHDVDPGCELGPFLGWIPALRVSVGVSAMLAKGLTR